MKINKEILKILKQGEPWKRLSDIVDKLTVKRSSPAIANRLKKLAQSCEVVTVDYGNGFFYAPWGTPSIQDDIYRARIIRVLGRGDRMSEVLIASKAYLPLTVVKRIMPTISGLETAYNRHGAITYGITEDVVIPKVPDLRHGIGFVRKKILKSRPKRKGTWEVLDTAVNRCVARAIQQGYAYCNPYEYMR